MWPKDPLKTFFMVLPLLRKHNVVQYLYCSDPYYWDWKTQTHHRRSKEATVQWWKGNETRNLHSVIHLGCELPRPRHNSRCLPPLSSVCNKPKKNSPPRCTGDLNKKTVVYCFCSHSVSREQVTTVLSTITDHRPTGHDVLTGTMGSTTPWIGFRSPPRCTRTSLLDDWSQDKTSRRDWWLVLCSETGSGSGRRSGTTTVPYPFEGPLCICQY